MQIRGIVANWVADKIKPVQRDTCWSRPASGCIKINVDASVHMGRGAGSCGAILRESKGSFIAAAVEFKQHALDAPTMEALAVLLGLQLAYELGIQSIAIESDSLDILHAIQNPSEYRASGAVIIDGYRKLMSSLAKRL